MNSRLRALVRPTLIASLGAAAALTAATLLGGAGYQWTTRQPKSGPPAPPLPTPAFALPGYTGPQYAVLIHTSTGLGRPDPVGTWEFDDRMQRYNSESMAQMFSLQPGDEYNPARIITAIASMGWELVSHTDSGFCVPSSSSDGNSSVGDVYRTEQWWFKKK